MFEKIKNSLKSGKQNIQKDIFEDSLFQFLQNDISKRIVYYSSTDIYDKGNNNLVAISNDPYFILHLPNGQTELSISLQIQSANMDCISALYFSYDKNQYFSEKNKLIFGNADGKLKKKHLIFPQPVYWLRLDPVDSAVDFNIIKVDIRVTGEEIPATEREEVNLLQKTSLRDAILKLNETALIQSWRNSRAIVFVTHEMSGTGAPLLCRKMSSMARRLGMRTVILSLSDCADNTIKQQFAADCDMLLICRQSEDIEYASKELFNLNINCAILNSVASGVALRYFNAAGFVTVCLIHEMKSSLKILQAQRWIKDFSLYADKVVFPASCVRDEFILFGGNVGEKSVILPQGYYKDIEPKVESSYKIEFMNKLGISMEAKLIVGAGSINFRKGVDLLPLIMLELQRLDNTEYHFLWLGTSSGEEYNICLQDQITRMNLSDRFHFLGYLSDEKEYMNLMSICDVLALVSREDPYPSVMIEAMNCNVPVVAFRGSGGADDLFAEGRGYLADYMNIPQYAQIIHRICNVQGFADDTKMRAKEYIKSHNDFKKYVKSILAFCNINFN